jgi:hypothetical protein
MFKKLNKGDLKNVSLIYKKGCSMIIISHYDGVGKEIALYPSSDYAELYNICKNVLKENVIRFNSVKSNPKIKYTYTQEGC